MRTYIWSDALSLGIPDIDAQHKEIFTALRELHLQLYDEVSVEELNEKLVQINQYRIEHFKTEETLMHAHKEHLLHYAEHIAAHREFDKGFEELVNRIPTEGSDIAREVYDFLGRWLYVHINGLDREMSEQLKNLDV